MFLTLIITVIYLAFNISIRIGIAGLFGISYLIAGVIVLSGIYVAVFNPFGRFILGLILTMT